MGKIWENDDQPLDLGGFPQDVQTKPWRSKHFKANWDCSHQIAPMFELHWSSFSTYKWLIQNDLWHEIQVQDLVGFAGEHVGGIHQKEWEVFRMPSFVNESAFGPNPKLFITLVDFQFLPHLPGFTKDSQRIRRSASGAYKRTSPRRGMPLSTGPSSITAGGSKVQPFWHRNKGSASTWAEEGRLRQSSMLLPFCPNGHRVSKIDRVWWLSWAISDVRWCQS